MPEEPEPDDAGAEEVVAGAAGEELVVGAAGEELVEDAAEPEPQPAIAKAPTTSAPAISRRVDLLAALPIVGSFQ